MKILDLYDDIVIKVRVFFRRLKISAWENEEFDRLDLLPVSPLNLDRSKTHEDLHNEAAENIKEIRMLLANAS